MSECDMCGKTEGVFFEFKNDDGKMVHICERCMDKLFDEACKWRGEQ